MGDYPCYMPLHQTGPLHTPERNTRHFKLRSHRTQLSNPGAVCALCSVAMQSSKPAFPRPRRQFLATDTATPEPIGASRLKVGSARFIAASRIKVQ